VLEGGRMATELMVRELQQITPSELPNTSPNSLNFYAAVINERTLISPPQPAFSLPTPYVPLAQSLPANGPVRRMNVLQDLFFIQRKNLTWTGIGYFVRPDGAFLAGWGPVGTLYRFETNNSTAQFQNAPAARSFFNTYLYATNFGPAGTSMNFSKVLDGIVHFRVRTYDTNGNWITFLPPGYTNNVSPKVLGYSITNAITGDAEYIFASNAVPAYVELEIGILEQPTLDRYKSIPDPVAQTEFLQNHAANVQIFRQRVAIRNLDPAAY